MASKKHRKHRKHSARRYRGLGNFLTGGHSAIDVGAGLLLGLAGSAAGTKAASMIEGLAAKHLGLNLPAPLTDLGAFAGGAAAGAAAYYLAPAKYRGHTQTIGFVSGLVGAGMSATKLGARYNLPGLSGIATVNLKGIVTREVPGAGRMGVVVDTASQRNLPNGGRLGVVVDTATTRASQFGVVVDDPRQVFGRRFNGIEKVRVP